MNDKIIEISDEEIEQVACDEMQQDWNDLAYQKVYHDGFVDGAKWLRGCSSSPTEDKVVDARALINELDSYIEFLGKIVGNHEIFMSTRAGYSEPTKDIQEGEERRKKIAKLREQYN